MIPRSPERGASLLPYESWVLRFEEISIGDLRATIPCPATDDILPSGKLAEAERLLLRELGRHPLFVGGADAVENPAVPRCVSEAAAEQEAAATLITNLFLALVVAKEAKAYAVPAAYDGDGLPDMLGPFYVVVLSGARSHRDRHVAYEGEWLLEHLVADNPGELREVHDGLRGPSKSSWASYDPGGLVERTGRCARAWHALRTKPGGLDILHCEDALKAATPGTGMLGVVGASPLRA